jgi:hypothetical protein
MNCIKIVGRGTEESLKDLKNFISAIEGKAGIFFVFVMGPAYDFAVGSVFKAQNDESQSRFELVAVTQQFDILWDEIPHGWKTICALRPLGNSSASVLEELPFTDSWYGNTTGLILECT